jgi:predicted anti-sigma-YlaC factor YlaD
MIRRRPDACVVYRPALLDFVERRALGPDSPAALDHLARCERCERDLSEVAQTIIALRRLGERARQVEAPADGWPSLRDRLERSQRTADEAARRLRRAFGSAMVGIAVVAVVAISSLTGTVTSGLVDRPAVALGARPAASTVARRYDPFAQPLTEGIVLAIAGGTARVSLAERVQNGPSSTDRIDDPPVFASVHITQEPIAPRTAYRT